MTTARVRDRVLRPCRAPAGLELSLQDAGIRVRDVIAAAGLAPDVLAEPRPALTIDEYLRLWDAIDAAAGDPLLGVRLGTGYPEHALEPALLVCIGSRDLGEALQRLVRYKRCLCPERLTLEHRGAHVELSYDWPTAHRAPPPILVEAELAFLLQLARRATRAPLREVKLALTRRAAVAPYARALQADVRMGAKLGRMILRSEELARPFVTYNPSLVAALEPALEIAAAASWSPLADPVAATREVLRRRLGHGPTTIHEVAAELAVATRTLQRQLRDAGTSFAAIVQALRRERALQFLRDSDMTTSEIAFLLGFETPSSFFRAFTRWTGRTPGEFRGPAVSTPRA